MGHSRALSAPSGFEIYTVTDDRWDDLERLFGPDGAFNGCWCAFWRLRHKDFQAADSADRKPLLQDRVEACDHPPGVLAYRDGEPVAWVSVEPRSRIAAFEYARVYTSVDDEPLSIISCFYLDDAVRGRGLTSDLLEAVKVHVQRNGGDAVEGYPEAPEDLGGSDTPGYMGLTPAFERAGFVDIAELADGRSSVQTSGYDDRRG